MPSVCESHLWFRAGPILHAWEDVARRGRGQAGEGCAGGEGVPAPKGERHPASRDCGAHGARLQVWHPLQNLPAEKKVVFIKSINIHAAW